MYLFYQNLRSRFFVKDMNDQKLEKVKQYFTQQVIQLIIIRGTLYHSAYIPLYWEHHWDNSECSVLI